jgi:hypothetical protein
MVTNWGLPIEACALPDDDLLAHQQLYNDWKAAYPSTDPIVQGLVLQAVMALIEIRRLERVRATVRVEKVRTALLFWEQENEDHVERYLQQFNIHPPSALVGLLRSAAGCRWALAFLGRLQKLLDKDGTWYGADMIGAIQIQGLSACVNELYLSEDAYMTWVWCLAAQPDPKQREIDRILDPAVIPKSFRDRDTHLWPLDPVECKARLQAMLDRETPRIRAIEATLRVTYEDPSRAEARTMALATFSKEEMPLLRAQRMHEQSYLQASTALMKFLKQAAARPVKRKAAAVAPAPAADAVAAGGGGGETGDPESDIRDEECPVRSGSAQSWDDDPPVSIGSRPVREGDPHVRGPDC